ncbi:hypothetical protein [Telluribacter sp. SYSU D00476]|uniref:hypothetical protein n=1 Tax=Telluribacter sp. SYSU D00476 TaxID=2811430 RepID=UPI001FF2E0E3|nr:hypothetical protein [Telluribacter sp. SYSU D00476]
MKTLKLLIVMMLISLQVSATGYSHNMFVAQKMLKAKKEVRKSAPKAQEAASVAPASVAPASVAPASVASARVAVVKATPRVTTTPSDQEEVKTAELTPAAFTQHLARWIVGFVCSDSNGDEKASGDSDGERSMSSHLVTLVERVIYALV